MRIYSKGAALVAALAFALSLQSCGEPAAPTAGNSAATPAAKAPASEPAPAKPRAVIAAGGTEWQAVESRLIRNERTGAMVQVEIELANTGTTPVALENYSATSATYTNTDTGQSVEPFQAGGPQIATNELTTTLQPGATAVVSATFPYPSGASRATIAFPKINPFVGVAIANAVDYTAPRNDGSR